jgi:hypothetical protein
MQQMGMAPPTPPAAMIPSPLQPMVSNLCLLNIFLGLLKIHFMYTLKKIFFFGYCLIHTHTSFSLNSCSDVVVAHFIFLFLYSSINSFREVSFEKFVPWLILVRLEKI